MKNLVCLLFLPGLFCNPNPVKINPDSLVTWKGSCVVIPCEINRYRGAVLRDISLFWYFQPYYDANRLDYSGHLLFNSSLKYPSRNRFQFVGNLQDNLGKQSCSLKISPVRTEDSGIYGARFFVTYSLSPRRDKWFLNATINVAESPPLPKMDISPKDLREGRITVTCSVPYYCPEQPLELIISGLGETRLSSQRTTINNVEIQTVVSFRVTWEDHQKSLLCTLRDQWKVMSTSTIPLDVKYAPKDVQMIASPGTVIREGETLSLECTIKSSNPEVSEYLWFKDDQLMDEWPKLKKIEFETEDHHFGVYRCEAKNSVGSETSSDLSIDVQYAPKDVQLVIENGQIPIKEKDTVTLNCSFSHSNPRDSISYKWYKGKSRLSNQEKSLIFSANLEHAGDYTCEVCNTIKCVPAQPITVDIHSHFHNASAPTTSAPEPTAESEGPRSSPLLPSTPAGVSSPLPSPSSPQLLSTLNDVSSPLPSTPCPPSLPPSLVSIPPLSSSQAPCDGSTQLEEFCFLSESLEQVMKAQNQFLHSFQELTSAMVKLSVKFQEALIKKMQKTCVVPREMKNP